VQIRLNRGYISNILNGFTQRKQAIDEVTVSSSFLVLPHSNTASCYCLIGPRAVFRVLMEFWRLTD